ncbi:unnamed protein product [Pedinophyceae sp. YPF-701]|nr:unnamed protein product [Pedinophyceae sp. YPF-701]
MANKTKHWPQVAFLIDTSYSMHGVIKGMTRMQRVMQTVAACHADLHRSALSIHTFSKVLKEELPRTNKAQVSNQMLQQLTGRLSRATETGESTALYDSVANLIGYLRRAAGPGSNGRSRVLLAVVTDGTDNCSRLGEKDMLRALSAPGIDLDVLFVNVFCEALPVGLRGVPGLMLSSSSDTPGFLMAMDEIRDCVLAWVRNVAPPPSSQLRAPPRSARTRPRRSAATAAEPRQQAQQPKPTTWRAFYKHLRDASWQERPCKDHRLFQRTLPDGTQQKLTVAATPSDVRALENTLANVRKLDREAEAREAKSKSDATG